MCSLYTLKSTSEVYRCIYRDNPSHVKEEEDKKRAEIANLFLKSESYK